MTSGDIVHRDLQTSSIAPSLSAEGRYSPTCFLPTRSNRAPAKVQSVVAGTLRAGRDPLEGQQTPLPAPFIVLATPEPNRVRGTYPLPEAQQDHSYSRSRASDFPSAADELRCSERWESGIELRDRDSRPAWNLCSGGRRGHPVVARPGRKGSFWTKRSPLHRPTSLRRPANCPEIALGRAHTRPRCCCCSRARAPGRVRRPLRSSMPDSHRAAPRARRRAEGNRAGPLKRKRSVLAPSEAGMLPSYSIGFWWNNNDERRGQPAVSALERVTPASSIASSKTGLHLRTGAIDSSARSTW